MNTSEITRPVRWTVARMNLNMKLLKLVNKKKSTMKKHG
jgi:hypothetical protein